MNVSGYTFNYCTLEDAAGQPHIIVPPDRNGIPCFPGDLVCDECDTDCKNPFEVMGVGAYDGKHDGAHCYIIDKDGESYFSDEVFHVQLNPFVNFGFEEKIV